MGPSLEHSIENVESLVEPLLLRQRVGTLELFGRAEVILSS
jgi:hypothetical protein